MRNGVAPSRLGQARDVFWTKFLVRDGVLEVSVGVPDAVLRGGDVVRGVPKGGPA